MAFIIYLLIAFIVFFFCYKKYYHKATEYAEQSYTRDVTGSKYFWICLFIPLFWFISLPGILIWKLLEKITKL